MTTSDPKPARSFRAAAGKQTPRPLKGMEVADDGSFSCTAVVREVPKRKGGGSYWVYEALVDGKKQPPQYLNGAQSLELVSGNVYDVALTPWRDTYRIVSVLPGTANTPDELVEFIKSVPGMGERSSWRVVAGLREEFGDLTGHQYRDRLKLQEDVAGFFAKMPGVNRPQGEMIASVFDSFDDVAFEFQKTLAGIGIRHENTARFEFALAFCRVHPDTMTAVAENPYTLCDVARRPQAKDVVKTAKDQGITVTVAGFPFDAVDDAVIAARPDWTSHRYRVREFIAQTVDAAHHDGHALCPFRGLLRGLTREGILYYTYGPETEHDVPGRPAEGETVRIDEDVVRHVVRTDRDEKGFQRFYVRHATRAAGGDVTGVVRADVERWQKRIAETVAKLVRAQPLFTSSHADRLLDRGMSLSGVTLSDEQMAAARSALGKRVSAVTGGPGTGKSLTTQVIMNALQPVRLEQRRYDPVTRSESVVTGMNIVTTAPTGAAAQRIRLGLNLTEDGPVDPATGAPTQLPVEVQKWDVTTAAVGAHVSYGGCYISTLHAFLGYRPWGTFELPPPAPTFLVLDESSMVDEEVFSKLMEWMQSCLDEDIPVSLLMVGDPDQLAPIGIGFPFRDLVAGPHGAYIARTNLSVVRRQGKGSFIVEASAAIRAQTMPPSPGKIRQAGHDPLAVDFYWATPNSFAHVLPVVETDDGPRPDVSDTVALVGEYTRFLEARGQVDPQVQILMPLRNPSEVEPHAAYTLKANRDLQLHYATTFRRRLVEYTRKSPESKFTDTVEFAVGDKVEHKGANGYDPMENGQIVMRGSIGVVTLTGPDFVLVQYPFLDTETVYGTAENLYGLRLAYAITGHSSQGSEYENVLLVVPEKAGGTALVDRSWLYTAVTRASKHLMFVATPARVKRALAHSNGASRLTMLPQHLSRQLS